MKVSVIIPCYNVEKYILQCLESVLNQTYENLEIICIDNNSADNTYGLLVEQMKKYPGKICVFQEFKKGASEARNKGIREATGEWIQFLDADDILLPDKINIQVQLLQNMHPDLIVGNYMKESQSKQTQVFAMESSWAGLIVGKLGITSSNLWKREKILEVGMWDDIKSSQEGHLMFKMLCAKAEVLLDNSFNTIVKNQNSDSISNSNLKENWCRYIELRLLIWNYLKKQNLITQSILKLLNEYVFRSIRILYLYDKAAAIRYHKKYREKSFSPSEERFLYLALYMILGFKNTEEVLGFLRK